MQRLDFLRRTVGAVAAALLPLGVKQGARQTPPDELDAEIAALRQERAALLFEQRFTAARLTGTEQQLAAWEEYGRRSTPNDS